MEATQLSKINHEVCEMIAIMIPEIQTLNIVIYRPPGTKLHEFDIILNEIENILQKLEKPDPTIIISGDFNFPFVKWKRMQNISCIWEYKTYGNATTDEKHQFEKLIDICDRSCILQIIEEPTREENTLDLLFTNEIRLITALELNKSKLSDHNNIEISTNYTTVKKPETRSKMEDSKEIIKSLNFQSKTIN